MEVRTAKGFVTPSHDDPINYNGLAGTTEGYSPMDLIDFIERGVHTAAMRQGGKVSCRWFSNMRIHQVVIPGYTRTLHARPTLSPARIRPTGFAGCPTHQE
jgi:hypothetical protein